MKLKRFRSLYEPAIGRNVVVECLGQQVVWRLVRFGRGLKLGWAVGSRVRGNRAPK
jgi:hypothetical protein